MERKTKFREQTLASLPDTVSFPLSALSSQARLFVRHGRAGFCAGEEGAALIETALILPALLAPMTAIMTFAAAFNNQWKLTRALGAAPQNQPFGELEVDNEFASR